MLSTNELINAEDPTIELCDLVASWLIRIEVMFPIKSTLCDDIAVKSQCSPNRGYDCPFLENLCASQYSIVNQII